MADFLEIVGRLPPEARPELLDFTEFLDRKYNPPSWPEAADWRAMSQQTLDKVWDNPGDDVYANFTNRETHHD
jgi:hypothetical protein